MSDASSASAPAVIISNTFENFFYLSLKFGEPLLRDGDHCGFNFLEGRELRVSGESFLEAFGRDEKKFNYKSLTFKIFDYLFCFQDFWIDEGDGHFFADGLECDDFSVPGIPFGN